MFTHQRKSSDLGGPWQSNPDPDQPGRQPQRRKRRSKPDRVFPGWDDDGLWDSQLPGTWERQSEDLKSYAGDAHCVGAGDAPVTCEMAEWGVKTTVKGATEMRAPLSRRWPNRGGATFGHGWPATRHREQDVGLVAREGIGRSKQRWETA